MLFHSPSFTRASRRVLLASRRVRTHASTAVDLSYTKIAPPSANETDRPLVLLHGLFGSKRNWTSHSRALSTELNRTVYALDLRNHGASPHQAPMTYSAMAEDVLHFLQNHQLKNVSLMGHSMGGKVAMTVALNPNLPDGLLENLIVEDTAPAAGARLTEFPGYIKGMRAVNAAKVTTRKEATDILSNWEKDPAILQFLLTNLELPPRVEHARFKIPLDILEEYTNNMGDFPYAPGERQWSGRTLFIRGTKSKYMNERNIPVVRQTFPNMQLRELPTGHWVHSERPQEFRKLVSQFIGPVH